MVSRNSLDTRSVPTEHEQDDEDEDDPETGLQQRHVVVHERSI
jgi:hypothetical protein